MSTVVRQKIPGCVTIAATSKHAFLTLRRWMYRLSCREDTNRWECSSSPNVTFYISYKPGLMYEQECFILRYDIRTEHPRLYTYCGQQYPTYTCEWCVHASFFCLFFYLVGHKQLIHISVFVIKTMFACKYASCSLLKVLVHKIFILQLLMF